MDRDRIISAPCTTDTEALLQSWHASHQGTTADFYQFITTPSADRDLFLFGLSKEEHRMGRVVVAAYGTPQ